MTRAEYDGRFEELARFVRTKCKQFDELVNVEADVVLLHQDAFAADLDTEELLLLGSFIKVLGHMGKEVRIIGRCRGTLTPFTE
jgi:hypothetical protein